MPDYKTPKHRQKLNIWLNYTIHGQQEILGNTTYKIKRGEGTGHPSRAHEFAPYFTCLCGDRVVQITCLRVCASVVWYTFRFPRTNDVREVFAPICDIGGSCFILPFVFIDVYWMMLVTFKSNMTGVTYGAGTAGPSRSLVFLCDVL
jgi:hypothetical protein